MNRFKDKWDADLAEMGPLFSENRCVNYLSYVTDVSTKFTQVKLFKDEKSKTVLNGLIKIDKYNRKLNK